MRFLNNYKNRFRFGQVKYNTIYAFEGNNESGIRSREVPVWRGLISIVLSVINLGPNNYYDIDRIPVCTGSGMYRLHCVRLSSPTGHWSYGPLVLRLDHWSYGPLVLLLVTEPEF